MHAVLFGQVNLVRFEQGLLEIRVGATAPANLAGRVGQCLSEWTGQRWTVSIIDKPGEPSLAEQDRAIETARQDRARNHPLTQAVLSAFPDAKLTALKQRIVAQPAPSGDDAAAPDSEGDPISNDED